MKKIFLSVFLVLHFFPPLQNVTYATSDATSDLDALYATDSSVRGRIVFPPSTCDLYRSRGLSHAGVVIVVDFLTRYREGLILRNTLTFHLDKIERSCEKENSDPKNPLLVQDFLFPLPGINRICFKIFADGFMKFKSRIVRPDKGVFRKDDVVKLRYYHVTQDPCCDLFLISEEEEKRSLECLRTSAKSPVRTA